VAYIKDSTVDNNTSLSQPGFVGGQPSISDYEPFVQRGFGPTFESLNSESLFYAGDYTETNLFESLKPIRINFGNFFLGTNYERFSRPILLIKDDHYVPASNAVGLSLIGRFINYPDFQSVDLDSDNYLQQTSLEIVEINDTDIFTVILRGLNNSKMTLLYPPSDQFAFVEGINLADEPTSATPQSVSARFLNAADDSTDNIASLAISNGGSGYPVNVGIPNVSPTGGTGTGLIVNIVTHATNDEVFNTVIVSEGQGYSNGDILTVPGGNNDATLTVTTDRTGQVADVTITSGAVTALSVGNLGTNTATGDLMEVTLGNGGKVKYRFVNGQTTYHNFTANLLVQIKTDVTHNYKVGDYIVVDHDIPANQILGAAGSADAKMDKGEHTRVDQDAIYFFYRDVSHAVWTNIPVFNSTMPKPKFVSTGGTGPLALATSDKINPTQMTITGSYNTIGQRLNPTFKAVKMTCASAWSIKESGSSTVTNVAANAEHIFRYYGDNDGFFQAQTQGGGSATLNWQYFVG